MEPPRVAHPPPTRSAAVNANHAISATFTSSSTATYMITATAGAGGSINPSGSVYVEANSDQAFVITPDANNKILDVIVDGVAQNGPPTSYTFNGVNANHAISASFVATSVATYTITASADSNGKITPSGSIYVAAGSDQAFSISPNANYKILNVLVDGAAQNGPPTSYTFSNVQANHAISASFAASSATTYVITATAGSGGTITPSGSVYVAQGGNQVFAIAPDAGNKILDVVVDGVAQSGPPNSYTFSSIGANHAISASFVATSVATYTITATATGSGVLNPSGSVYVAAGASQTFTITPNTNYKILNVLVDGAAQSPPPTTYIFNNVAADHTIAASFISSSTTTYVITATAGAGGSISPSGAVNVASGSSQTFTIAANTGYHISGVTVDGSSAGTVGTYTFSSVSGNHAISAQFTSDQYTITVTQTSGGTISPSGVITLNPGASQTFTITPIAGNKVLNLFIDGVAQSGTLTSYTFTNVQANHAITATYTLSTTTTYIITATAGTGGTINPSGPVNVATNTNQAFTIAANTGYSISDVLVDSSSVGAVASYTFTNVITNHAITASFTLRTYTITASAGSGGSIAPSGAVVVNAGASQTFTITPIAGNKVLNLFIDGVAQSSSPTSYTFYSVAADHTISVTFTSSSTVTYVITATADAGGSINPSGSVNVPSGDSQAFAIAPTGSNKILNVLVDGAAQNGPPTSYTFSNVVANHAISASFVASSATTYVITATAVGSGTITPSGSVYVASGNSQIFAIAPTGSNKILNVQVDGVDLSGPPSSYTFTNVVANHAITASSSLPVLRPT